MKAVPLSILFVRPTSVARPLDRQQFQNLETSNVLLFLLYSLNENHTYNLNSTHLLQWRAYEKNTLQIFSRLLRSSRLDQDKLQTPQRKRTYGHRIDNEQKLHSNGIYQCPQIIEQQIYGQQQRFTLLYLPCQS